MGYSDITAMLYALYQNAGLVCFHGPMGTSDYNDYTTRYFKEVLMNPSDSLTYAHPDSEPLLTLTDRNEELSTEASVGRRYIGYSRSWYGRRSAHRGKLVAGNFAVRYDLRCRPA